LHRGQALLQSIRAQQKGSIMMALIFATMLAALAAATTHRPLPALLAAGLSLFLAIWLFLWEIWSPETGFRMPWIQTELLLPDAGEAA
jgi:hypothetical protein